MGAVILGLLAGLSAIALLIAVRHVGPARPTAATSTPLTTAPHRGGHHCTTCGTTTGD